MTSARVLLWERGQRQLLVVLVAVLSVFRAEAESALGPRNVVILVNGNSRTSQYIARLYRTYYPEITASQVLSLSGLPDSSGPTSTPADEIITREVYDELIAGPVRDYLLDPCYPGRIYDVMCIITTAGMPYRIEDVYEPDVIMPAGSDAGAVVRQERVINAASVESELSCLWITDRPGGVEAKNRIVNPYQGYRGSSITHFPRYKPDEKIFTWSTARSSVPQFDGPVMEGTLPRDRPPMPPDFKMIKYYGTVDRQFNAGDMYLTCRLDGPKDQGRSAVFAVRNMLERAQRASDMRFGVRPDTAVAVLDDDPTLGGVYHYDSNRVYNLDKGSDCVHYDEGGNIPPDAPFVNLRDDYVEGFYQLTGLVGNGEALYEGRMTMVQGGIKVILDRRAQRGLSQGDLSAGEQVIAYSSYGTNGDCGRGPDYLYTGREGTKLFELSNGAVFTALESYNAVTMFNDPEIGQAKIIDFISIGGTGAIGYAFEPQPDATVDNEFLFYNLLADDDGDGWADLTFVEAAFTALPYLSWSEVVVGDPLMRYCYLGSGQTESWYPKMGDVDMDNRINIIDIMHFKSAQGGSLYGPENYFRIYNDLCDMNKDGRINIVDIMLFKQVL